MRSRFLIIIALCSVAAWQSETHELAQIPTEPEPLLVRGSQSTPDSRSIVPSRRAPTGTQRNGRNNINAARQTTHIQNNVSENVNEAMLMREQFTDLLHRHQPSRLSRSAPPESFMSLTRLTNLNAILSDHLQVDPVEPTTSILALRQAVYPTRQNDNNFSDALLSSTVAHTDEESRSTKSSVAVRTFGYFPQSTKDSSVHGSELSTRKAINIIEGNDATENEDEVESQIVKEIIPTVQDTDSLLRNPSRVKVTNSVCPICLEEYDAPQKTENGWVFTPLQFLEKCNHGFHPACLTGWLLHNTNCPLCRQ